MVMSKAADTLEPRALRRPEFLLVITEPDQDLAVELAAELQRHRVDTEVCASGADALLAAGSMRPDAVLVAAEHRGGLTTTEIVQVLSRRAGIPVVVGVGESDGVEAAAALAAGAWACIARPWRVPELIPILRAIRPDTVANLDPPMECGVLLLDPVAMEVRLRGKPITMPLKEYQVLRYLMNHVGRVVTREQIYQSVWGETDEEAASNTLTVHIKRLRKRLGDDLKNPHIILTVRPIGYRLVPPPEIAG